MTDDPLQPLIDALRSTWPQADTASLAQVANQLLRGQSAILGTNTASLTFGESNDFGDATVTVGNIAGGSITNLTINFPSPDPLQEILAPLASLPVDTLPLPTNLLPSNSRIRLPCNPFFVGRTEELRKLALAMGGPTTTILTPTIVTGIGGIGKTNLATEFVYRYGRYFTGGVFWLNCADAAAIPSEIAACAPVLGLSGYGGPLDETIDHVYLKWQEHIPRLLIFDNCEDPQVLAKWMPKFGGCRVLVTSRRSYWSNANVISIGTLPRSESIALVTKICPRLTETHIDLLAASLGDLPLALHVAASYLFTYDHVTVDTYCDQLSLNHPSLHEGRGTDESPTDHDLSVARTFAVSVNRLDGKYPIDSLAQEFLVRIAYFAAGIPVLREHLYSTFQHVPDNFDAIDALRRLQALGLIENQQDIILHRLLAGFVKQTYANLDAQNAVATFLIDQLDHIHIPHNSLLIIQHHLIGVTDEALATGHSIAMQLATTLGCGLLVWEQFEQAQYYLTHALQLTTPEKPIQLVYRIQRALIEIDLKTGKSLAIQPWEDLVDAYIALGENNEAARTVVGLAQALNYRREMAQLSELLARWLVDSSVVNQPYVLGHLTRLQAMVLLNEGRIADAVAVIGHAITAFEKGHCLIESTNCMLDLAWIKLLEGDSEQAVRWLEDADAVFRHHQLPLRRALCVHNLSIAYLAQGEFAPSLYTAHEARRLFKQTNRPLDMGSSALQLGRVYACMGHWTAAIAHFIQAITIFETLGTHGRLSASYYNLAIVRIGKGDLEDALEICHQAEVLAHSENQRDILYELAMLRVQILSRLGQFDAAYELLNMLDDQYAALNNQLEQARCWVEKAWLNVVHGVFESAQNLFTQALPILNERPIFMWQVLHGLARCHQEFGNYDEALKYYDRGGYLVSELCQHATNSHLYYLSFLQIKNLFNDALCLATAYGTAELVKRLTDYYQTLPFYHLLNAPLKKHPNIEIIEVELLDLIKTWNIPIHQQAVIDKLDLQLELYAEQTWLHRDTLP
jgi:tetratricopeptide (TPR) repeat protein